MDMYCPACGSRLTQKGRATYMTLSEHASEPNKKEFPKRETYKCPNRQCFFGVLTGLEDVQDGENGVRKEAPYWGVEGGFFNLDGHAHILLSHVLEMYKMCAVRDPGPDTAPRPNVARLMGEMDWSTDPVELEDEE